MQFYNKAAVIFLMVAVLFDFENILGNCYITLVNFYVFKVAVLSSSSKCLWHVYSQTEQSKHIACEIKRK